MPTPHPSPVRARAFAWALTGVLAASGCEGGMVQGGQMPDELPQRLNNPFHYPPRLYEQKVQGNVVLRLFIDTTGRVLPESTQVLESSGYPALDSAAVRGSEELEFTPARLNGKPLAVSVRHPVFFRRRDTPPLPGDSVLRDSTSTDRS